MNKLLLQPEVQSFICANLSADIPKLLLKKSPFEGISSSELATQIISKNKCKEKLPKWFETKGIYFPSKLSVEQSSSEKTANYKSTLVGQGRLLDMTGGFGVDTYYFAQQCTEVIHCELQKELSEIVAYNFSLLGQNKVRCISEDSFTYLSNNKEKFATIYLDPTRRQNTSKVFLLKDCIPNVPSLLSFLWQHTDTILLKTSPMLDIEQAIKELDNVVEVHIVALHNEVKELLFLLKKVNNTSDIVIKTINILDQKIQKWSFLLSQEKEKAKKQTFALPEQYLYEPNAAIMKSGGFSMLNQTFPIQKLAKHTHLYTNKFLLNDFQGRTFQIEKVLTYDKSFKTKYAPKQANIATRNFPLSVTQIRQQLKIKDGGELYLFFTTNMNQQKIVIFCRKV